MVLILSLEEEPENLILKVDNVKLKIDSNLLSTGTLFLSQESLRWQPSNRQDCLVMPWTEVALHAISSDPRCIYIMLDFTFTWAGVHDPTRNGNAHMIENDDDEGNESDAEPEMTEMWFMPNDPTTIESIFQAMKDCQGLNPDHNESLSEDEGEDMQMSGEEDAIEEYEHVGEGNFQNLNLNEDRFADAEDDDNN